MSEPDLSISKGRKLFVKAPPYYEKEYLYEVTSAGDKQIRANLYKSPTVKKAWSREEFFLLIEMGVVRLADDTDDATSA